MGIFSRNGSLSDIEKVTTKEEAEQYLTDYADWIAKEGKKPAAEARRIANANVGYFIGYYDGAARKRMHALFNVEHPVFGGKDY